ncbi:PREDICTED: threonylcarbamoyladenosine tRNA methylthiotransferase [Vollenhovia emeryi]|uniref:threonylcarbamoyladenosine tRNA methylthiotransferase n=1 Tax=Vollenhovia emeryi TaxID=411798 RepID=UPI0005F363B6|nr:PREDICTED: threonylcarbamoyladenosine tRNA methylthiotransferase [Vollenhovia emeryi]XP_011873194.1 PREDICTED: threonylcarbamoyladenosine tRNA methylthiotransferase [Vollenhovia emeryi]XP_011873195.1 PREDICTED: threonylcarbamoyladenosine tRNA methylthiotransferase [Vollenhovia emeryi]
MPAPCEDIIEDIEDLIASQDITPKERYSSRKHITIRPKRKTQEQVLQPSVLSSIIPGTQTIYVKTWGCTHNSSDTEYMAGQLATYGYNLTEDKLMADLWLLNSCTVKSPAEDQFRNEIEYGKKLGKHVVVAGCVPQGAPKSSYLQGLSMIGVQQIDRVLEVVEETLKGNTVRFLQQKKDSGKKTGGASLSLPKVRRNPLIEIIAINTGCLNQCTYCKTKHARGELGSYLPEQIVERAKQAFEEGVCELWLTSEDTGAYGRDIGTSLPELLWQLVDVIPDGCMMRVGMTNPPYILEHLDEMAKILRHPGVYSFLHIPVQSGSDQVLADMKREYTRADFEHVVDFLSERVPGLTIATDIICGFPTETEVDFEETMALCQKYKFPSLFINQFFSRPGTPAARMPKVPTQKVKTRTKRLSDFFQSYEPYGHKVGLEQKVLVTEVSHDKQHYVGHNKFYEQVLIPMKQEYMGKMIDVKIIEATKFSMRGEPIGKGVSPSLRSPLPRGVVSRVPYETKPSKYGIATVMTIFLAVIIRILWKFLT